MAEDPLHRLHRKQTTASTNQQYHVWKGKQPMPLRPLTASSRMTSPLPSVASRDAASTNRHRAHAAYSPSPRKQTTTPSRRLAPTRVATSPKKRTTASKKPPAHSQARVEKAARLTFPEHPLELFDRMDDNASGKLSLAELDKGIVQVYPDLNNKPALMRAYKSTDASGDGFVCRDEFPAFLQFIVYYNNLWTIFSALDKDGDRRISKDEFHKVAPKFAKAIGSGDDDADAMFAAIDIDGKGMILFAELCHYLADQKWHDTAMDDLHDILQDDNDDANVNDDTAKAANKTKNVKKAAPKPQAVAKIALPEKSKAMEQFDKLDENASGKLSLAELDKAIVTMYPNLDNKAAIMRAYKSSDTTGDGFVGKSEFMDFLQYIVYYNNLWAFFDAIDTDSDRRIHLEEMQQNARLFTVDSIEELFAAIDKNGGGKILFAELCEYLAKHPGVVNEEEVSAVTEANTAVDTLEI